MDLAKLLEPFPSSDVLWRIGQAGKKKNGDVWAKVLAYIDCRNIMERLDAVVGPANWKNEYKPGPDGGVLCGISIRVGEEWITKWDGAENTDIESVKGGLSDSMKRAAVHWGIGRYLYDLGESWAVVKDDGKHYTNCKVKVNGKEEFVSFNWDTPQLPESALPDSEKKQPKGKASAPPKQQSKPAASTKSPGPPVELSAEDATYLDDLKVQVAAEDVTSETLNAMAFVARSKAEPLRTEALKVIRLRQIELCETRNEIKAIAAEAEKDGAGVKDGIAEGGKQRWNSLPAQVAA